MSFPKEEVGVPVGVMVAVMLGVIVGVFVTVGVALRIFTAALVTGAPVNNTAWPVVPFTAVTSLSPANPAR